MIARRPRRGRDETKIGGFVPRALAKAMKLRALKDDMPVREVLMRAVAGYLRYENSSAAGARAFLAEIDERIARRGLDRNWRSRADAAQLQYEAAIEILEAWNFSPGKEDVSVVASPRSKNPRTVELPKSAFHTSGDETNESKHGDRAGVSPKGRKGKPRAALRAGHTPEQG